MVLLTVPPVDTPMHTVLLFFGSTPLVNLLGSTSTKLDFPTFGWAGS